MPKSRLPVPASVEHVLDTALDRALAVQRPAVIAYLNRIRRRSPQLTPADLIRQLERRYRAAVVGTGAASGGAAALPGVGTAASLASGAAEITAFVSTTAMYVLALAEVHDVPTGDPQVRRALVLTVLLGEIGEAGASGVEITGAHWAHALGRTVDKDAVRGINNRLAHLFLTRFGAKQGILFAGRALPFGIGAGVGAVGNAALARSIIASSRRTFGPPPAVFPTRVVDATATKAAPRELPPER